MEGTSQASRELGKRCLVLGCRVVKRKGPQGGGDEVSTRMRRPVITEGS